MPTMYGDSGTVRMHRDSAGGGMSRLRCHYETDSDGYASMSLPFAIVGTLVRFSSRCPARASPLTGFVRVLLIDEWGVDQLDGLCTQLDPDGSEDGPLYLDLDGSDRRRPLLSLRPRRILFDRSATAPKEIVGVFDLYWSAAVQCPAVNLIA